MEAVKIDDQINEESVDRRIENDTLATRLPSTACDHSLNKPGHHGRLECKPSPTVEPIAPPAEESPKFQECKEQTTNGEPLEGAIPLVSVTQVTSAPCLAQPSSATAHGTGYPSTDSQALPNQGRTTVTSAPCLAQPSSATAHGTGYPSTDSQALPNQERTTVTSAPCLAQPSSATAHGTGYPSTDSQSLPNQGRTTDAAPEVTTANEQQPFVTQPHSAQIRGQSSDTRQEFVHPLTLEGGVLPGRILPNPIASSHDDAPVNEPEIPQVQSRHNGMDLEEGGVLPGHIRNPVASSHDDAPVNEPEIPQLQSRHNGMDFEENSGEGLSQTALKSECNRTDNNCSNLAAGANQEQTAHEQANMHDVTPQTALPQCMSQHMQNDSGLVSIFMTSHTSNDETHVRKFPVTKG